MYHLALARLKCPWLQNVFPSYFPSCRFIGSLSDVDGRSRVLSQPRPGLGPGLSLDPGLRRHLCGTTLVGD